MTTRTRVKTFAFLNPFRLLGLDEAQPAGSYVVETDEELLEGLSFVAYRRLSTYIHLAGKPHSHELSRIIAIDPAELASVLERDAKMQEPCLRRPRA